MHEFEIIAEIFAPLAGEGSFGLKDDAALIAPHPGFDLVVTTDAIAEGTDFFAFDPAATIARKALRVNLSDLAAKGAAPISYLLNIALPPSITSQWLRDFAQGLKDDQAQFGVSLLGGDTARTDGPLSIAVTAFGFVPQGKMVRRAGARPGDAIYVTGTIGDSGGGLAIFRREKHALDEAQRTYLIDRYRLPQPPLRFGAALAAHATASIDVSDGLVADLGHVAAASGVGMIIDAAAIPRSAALRALWDDDPAAIVRAATAGDDYQVAFTAADHNAVMTAARDAAVTVTRIGQVETGKGVRLLLNGQQLAVQTSGYSHF
ncbi:MAG: thiamine-phosphate kinase [Alphaproteobacteria bacterium]|nr:thiamine-phosphate kinase [Alphaproteobacteria bacterium]